VKNFRSNSVFQGKRRLFKILNDKKHIFNTVNSGHTLFFRASVSCSKFCRIKNIFNTVNSGHTLFFRASKSYSNILNVKSILNTAKTFMTKFVFGASASSSKILKDKNISTQWKFSGKALFFRASASCSKFWIIKNIYIQYNEFRARSVFHGKPQVVQKSWKIKKYFNTVKNFMPTLFYRASKLFKNLNVKNQWRAVRGGKEGSSSLSIIMKCAKRIGDPK